ncbi:Isoprenoid synthase [Gracilaria domingensis]|nr:Isoprenoid synthase [Gracilaria domingensis]
MAAGSLSELIALIRYKRKAAASNTLMTAALDDDWKFAYTALSAVSRSFALVIMELDTELRHPICIFYLVLRALDTIEDDTSVDPAVRHQICSTFWNNLESNVTDDESCGPWSSSEFGSGFEKTLCEKFPCVLRCFKSLHTKYQTTIRDITRRMGCGMAEHIQDVSCETVKDYDLYCHYVAGLVGYGLSDIFANSGYEDSSFSERTDLSNSMGLFLQKTNIIRDYLEDINEGRTFWPKEIWSNYGNELSDLRDRANRKFALAALNHMVTDALGHVPDCLEYMSRVHTNTVFKFVAIPQVMAIATLAECYNNGKIFEGVVKIRRSKTADLVLRTKSMDYVYKVFFECARAIIQKIEPHDPNADRTRQRLNCVLDICVPHVPATPDLIIPNVLSIILFCGLSSYVLKRRQEHFDGAVFTWRSAGGIMEPRDMLAIASLFLREEVRRMQQSGRNVHRRERVVTLED